MATAITSALARTATALTLAITFGAPGHAQTAAALPDYSAQAVHILPNGTKTVGKVIKSGPNLRMEYSDQGRQIVQILRRADGVMYMLDPAARSYVEVRGKPSPDPTGAGYLPPCQEDNPAVVCTFKGNEVSSGITGELWELTAPGRPGVATVLWDGARHRALRESFPDGTVMKMVFKAMEDLGGRQVEHWVVTYQSPGKPAQTGDWFYDPKLRVEVREVLPTGEVRSLEDIKVGPVDPSNFTVPQGWTRQEPPQVPAAPAPAPAAPPPAPPGSGN